MSLRSAAVPKKYLLMPSVPTPNGPLHLGHMGGPYLSADIFARHVRSWGHHTIIIAGTDSYESYVICKAEAVGKTPEEICDYYHHLIHKDLKSFHIGIDAMINPLSPSWKQSYHHWHEHLLKKLTDSQCQVIHRVQEKVLWDCEKNIFLTGGSLQGACPICQKTVAGYFCEHCGAHFKPEEIKGIQKRHSWLEKQGDNLFVYLPEYTDLTSKGIREPIARTYQQFLAQQNHLFRLTANTHWGLPVPQSHELLDSRLFSYGFIFAYFLMMGEIAGKLDERYINAFAFDSDVITIATFGFDNTIPFLASILGISTYSETYKPFDYYFINYFYHLNGYKFSTSRNHTIWVSDIVKGENPYIVDVIRFFLSLVNVREQSGNVDSFELQQFQHDFLQWIESELMPTAELVMKNKSLISSVEGAVMQNGIKALKEQQDALQAVAFSPHRAAHVLFNWIQTWKEIEREMQSIFWWLKSFALLSWPFMPIVAQKIWSTLGYRGEPMVDMFLQPMQEQ